MESTEQEQVYDDQPLIPQHTKQAAKAIGLLLFYSFLMFTLPFASFYGTKHVLLEKYHIKGFENTVWSVVAAVVTVYLIIFLYVYQAYRDTEYDEFGNEIVEDQNEIHSKNE